MIHCVVITNTADVYVHASFILYLLLLTFLTGFCEMYVYICLTRYCGLNLRQIKL